MQLCYNNSVAYSGWSGYSPVGSGGGRMFEIQVALTTGIFIVALVNLVIIIVDKMNNNK